MGLENIIGKRVENGANPPTMTYSPLEGKQSDDSKVFYTGIGYLSNALNDNGQLIVNEKGEIQGFTGTDYERKAANFNVTYQMFENALNCSKISGVPVKLDSNDKTVDNLTSVKGAPVAYLLGELVDYLSKAGKIDKKAFANISNDNIIIRNIMGHNCGLESFFNNAYLTVIRNTNRKDMKEIEAQMKNGNLKPFLERCNILASDAERGGGDMNQYIRKNLAEVAQRLYDTITNETRNNICREDITEEDIADEVGMYLRRLDDRYRRNADVELVIDTNTTTVKKELEVLPKTVLKSVLGEKKNGVQEMELKAVNLVTSG